MSEDILKTVVFTSLPAVFWVGPLSLEKALGQVVTVPARGSAIRGQQVGSWNPQQDSPCMDYWHFLSNTNVI